jgi:hypothetical protein
MVAENEQTSCDSHVPSQAEMRRVDARRRHVHSQGVASHLVADANPSVLPLGGKATEVQGSIETLENGDGVRLADDLEKRPVSLA